MYQKGNYEFECQLETYTATNQQKENQLKSDGEEAAKDERVKPS